MLLLALDGLLLLRLAARQLLALLFHLPPRITRFEPCGRNPRRFSVYRGRLPTIDSAENPLHAKTEPRNIPVKPAFQTHGGTTSVSSVFKTDGTGARPSIGSLLEGRPSVGVPGEMQNPLFLPYSLLPCFHAARLTRRTRSRRSSNVSAKRT